MTERTPLVLIGGVKKQLPAGDTLAKSLVGLGLADNTPDIQKPVSSPTAAALLDAGGQNLAYNSAFLKVSSADSRVADGWEFDVSASVGNSTGTIEIVPSFINPAENAQRLTVTNLNTGTYYRSLVNSLARVFKVNAGQTVTGTIRAKGTAGLQLRIFIQALDSKPSAIAAPASGFILLTGSQQNISFTYPNLPASTVGVRVFYRLYAGPTVTDGTVDLARPKLEIGSYPTGWSDDTGSIREDIASRTAQANARIDDAYKSGFVLGEAVSRGLASPNDQPLGTVKAYNGYDSQAAAQGWPVLEAGNSGLPVWWNVSCVGVGGRETQIAVQAFNVSWHIGRAFARSRHDTTWGEWKELTNAVRETVNGNGTALRYPDGTLICRRNTSGTVAVNTQVGSVFVSASIGFTFPEAFVDIPSVSPYAITPGAAISWAGSEGAAQREGFTARALSLQNSNTYVGYIAIGRWK